ncbi:MAG: phosphoadenylyl-sulfate reductase [Pseudomonadota bacterium]
MRDRATQEQQLSAMTATQRVEWALAKLPGEHILSSSFGAQAAVMLHLVSTVKADIPVVMIDTGYLFPETYRFANELVERLKLDLRVYRPVMSAAWQEANYGRRWEQGADGIADYNRENKVEPMARALEELNTGTWFAGLRRNQSASRKDTAFVSRSGERFKVHPIADWSDRDIYDYLKAHRLPYHPLWDQGYVSIGDTHTTRSLSEVSSEEELRFFGITRECGLHEMPFGKSA